MPDLSSGADPLGRDARPGHLKHVNVAVVTAGSGGVDRAGGDGVNTDAGLRPLYGQALVEGGGGVVREVGVMC